MQKAVFYISIVFSIFVIILYINYRVGNNNLSKEDVIYAEAMDNSDALLTDKEIDLAFYADWQYLTTDNQIFINSFILDDLPDSDLGTIYIIKKGNDNNSAVSFSLPISSDIEYSIDESGYYKVIFAEDNENSKVTDITSIIGIGHCDTIE